MVLIAPNIFSAFSATGIWFFNSTKILQQLQIKTPSPSTSDGELKRKTPKSVRGVHRAVKAVRAKDFDLGAGIDLITRATEKLAIEKNILQHEVNQLRRTLVHEKNHRKRGKKIKLFAKNELG